MKTVLEQLILLGLLGHAIASILPSSCADMKTKGQTSDGEYQIYIQDRKVRIYCHNMATEEPKEYILLYNTNFAEQYGPRQLNGDQCSSTLDSTPYNARGKTTFSAIRLKLGTMEIEMDDFTFSTTVDNKIPYGTSGDCYSWSNCPKGTFRIDLTGTDFYINSTVTWESVGYLPHWTGLSISSDRKIASATCGGWCGWCQPVGGAIKIAVDQRYTDVIATSCADLKAKGQTSDGEYQIYIQDRKVRIYCHNMATEEPKEYILLYNTNFAEQYGPRQLYGDQCSSTLDSTPYNARGKTTFSAIRLKLGTMEIEMDDFTFSTTVDNKIPFGTSGDCYSWANCPKGTFQIDLSETDFYIDSTVTWESVGWLPHWTGLSISSDRKIASATCGGWCGWCQPVGGVIKLAVWNGGITDMIPDLPLGFIRTYDQSKEYVDSIYKMWTAEDANLGMSIQRCTSLGGSLATVTTQNQGVLVQMLADHGLANALIGLVYKNGSYEWSDGSAVNVFSFSFPSADFKPPSGQNCVLLKAVDASWSATDCNGNHRGICTIPHRSYDHTLQAFSVGGGRGQSADEASAFCSSQHGGFLSTLQTVEQFQFAKNRLASFPECKYSWMGMKVGPYGEPLSWESGLPVLTTSWNGGRPSNFSDESCSMIHYNLAGWYNTLCNAAVSCFTCDVVLATVVPTTTSFKLNLGTSRFALVIAEWNSGSYKTVKNFSLKPGATYYGIINDTLGKIPLLGWSDATLLKTHCDCRLNAVNNGDPIDLKIVQQGGVHYISWTSVGACHDSYVLTRNNAQKGTVYHVPDLSNCHNVSIADDVVGKDGSFNPDGSDVGKSFEYCVRGVKQATGYFSNWICKKKALWWVGQISGNVMSVSGEPVDNVNLTIWAQSDPSISAWTVTDQQGKFFIELIEEKLLGLNHNFFVQPSKVEGNSSHAFNVSQCTGPQTCIKSDGTVDITLKHLTPYNLQLIDKSVFILEGSIVFQNSKEYTNGIHNCPTPDAIVCVEVEDRDPLCKTTDDYGHYQFAIPLYNLVTISVTYSTEGRVHDVQAVFDHPLTFIMTEDTVVDFEVTSLSLLLLDVHGGNCDAAIGDGNLEISAMENKANCRYKMTVMTTKNQVMGIYLPPMNIQVDFISLSNPVQGISAGHVGDYMPNKTRYAFLKRVDEATISYQYHSRPYLKIHSVGGQPKCQDSFVVKGGSTNFTAIELRIWEEYSSIQCYVTGQITFYDGLMDKEYAELYKVTDCIGVGCSGSLNVSDNEQYGFIIASTLPGLPNRIKPHTRRVSFAYVSSVFSLSETSVYEDVIVEGNVPFGEFFSNEIPLSLPSLFLFDPPGGQSYAWIEEGVGIESEVSLTLEGTLGTGFEIEGGAGINTEAAVCAGGGIGVLVLTCTSLFNAKVTAGAFASAGAQVGTSYSSSLRYAFKTTSRISTSALPGLPPPWGDVVVVAAITLRKSRADIVEVRRNATNCEVVVTESYKWMPQWNGYAVRTVYDIVNYDIPDLNHAIQIEMAKPAEERNNLLLEKLNNGVNMWNTTLALHDDIFINGNGRKQLDGDNHVNCEPWQSFGSNICENNGNSKPSLAYDTIFFTGGGTTYQLQSEMEHSKFTGFTQSAKLELQLGTHLAAEGGAGPVYAYASTKFWGALEQSVGSDATFSETSTTKTGFLLGDSDLGDKFQVQMYASQAFGTPVFKLLSGTSSCPWEPGTVMREKLTLAIGPYIPEDPTPPNAHEALAFNIPQDQPALFTLGLTNLGETDEGFDVDLAVDETTNPHGLRLVIGGRQWSTSTLRLPAGTPIVFLLEASRGPVLYNYTGVVISAKSTCEARLSGLYRNPIGDQVRFGVQFLQPCMKIAWTGVYAEERVTYASINQAHAAQLEVTVRNPEFPTLKWNSNPRFEVVRVEVKIPGSSKYEKTWTDSKFTNEATLTEDDYGYASVRVDVTNWALEGIYYIIVTSVCTPAGGAVGENLNSFRTDPRAILVDRTTPKLFGQFGQPADGSYFPGDEISLTFDEDIDCSLETYAFEGGITITNANDTNAEITKGGTWPGIRRYLQILCRQNVIQFAFGRKLLYNTIMGKKATIYVKTIRDIAGNINSDVLKWGFKIEPVDPQNLHIIMEGFLITTTIDNYLQAANAKRASGEDVERFKDQFCTDVALLLNMDKSRCQVDQAVESGNSTNIKFSFLPANDPNSPDVLALYEKLLNYVEDDIDSIPEELARLKEVNVDAMTYIPVPTIPEETQATQATLTTPESLATQESFATQNSLTVGTTDEEETIAETETATRKDEVQSESVKMSCPLLSLAGLLLYIFVFGSLIC